MRRLWIALAGLLLLVVGITYVVFDSVTLTMAVTGGLALVGLIAFKVIDSIFPVKVLMHMVKGVKREKGELGTVFKDISFKKVGAKEIKLDIYMPLNGLSANIPVTIYIHGGAWLFGDKGDILRLQDAYKTMKALREKGHAVVSINHRLLKKGETHLHHVVEDCKDAVRWIRRHLADYNFNGNSIGVWGQSSGGHAALMVGLTSDEQFVGDESLSQYSAKVNYILDHYAPSDFIEFFRINSPFKRTWILNKILGASFDLEPDEANEQFTKMVLDLSVNSHVRQDAPATMVIHGTADSVVSIKQSELLVERMKELGAPIEYWFVEGLDHAFAGASAETTNSIIDRSVGFVLQNDKGSGGKPPEPLCIN